MTDMKAMVALPHMAAKLSYPHSNQRDPDHYATITLTDETSGQEIAKIELNPDQLFRLMANNTAYGNGRATTKSHRLGLHVERQRIHLDRKEWGLAYDSDETHPAIAAHLTELPKDGWEVVTYDQRRGEHYIECARWVDVAE